MPFFWAIAFSAFAEEDYPGSQAYNKTQLSSESVNAATGTFDYSYPLISAKGHVSNFQLHLSYRFNKEGMFSLPNGWQLDLDFIKEKSAFINGQEWLINQLWRDETGFGSGLRYYNLHGTSFIDKGEAKEIPGHQGVSYRYRSNHKDGSIKYFSHQGLIVIEEDRFGNFIKFDYEEPISSLRSARLKTLTDNYGNQYRFDYVPGGIILTSPDKRKTQIYFNKNGVEAIANPMGQRTEFTYTNFAGRNLLRTIQTPKGLMTQISYSTINYSDGNSKRQMPVVHLLEKIDLAKNKKIEETHYTYSEDNNFTGYPMYSLSNNSDSLMDSQDKSYRYSVEITRSELIGRVPQNNRKRYYYNYLHLPIEVLTLKDGLPHIKTTYEYAISPFKYSRSTNYDKPRETINWIWDNSQKIYIPSDKILTTYDLYGNKIKESRLVFDRVSQQWRAVHHQTKAWYNEAFGLEKENIRKDALTDQVIRTRYTLSKDKKTHADKIIHYKKQNETTWKPWQKFSIVHDDLGRKTYSSSQWLLSDQLGPQKTAYTKEYAYHKDSGLLTVKQTSHLGAEHTEIQDTRSGNLIEKRTPTGSIWQYEYDDLDRLTKETNPLGKATAYTHQNFDKDGINQIIKETPLHYKVATVTDAAGRVTEHKDFFHNDWRRLSAMEYNGWNKVTKHTNILGLDTKTTYDQFERHIQQIDYWGNIHRIDYDDLHLTSTTYLNQHKVKKIEKQPWFAKTIHRKYPVFDNPNDPQTHFLEETLEKNGFGQNIRHTSALIHRQTLKPVDMIRSDYRYDPSFNRISKTIQGFDGLKLTRLSQYDIFQNPVTETKIQTIGDKTSQARTDLSEFNEDNQLIKVVTSEKMTTQFINDKEGRRIKTIQPDGSDIRYEYNLLGQIVKNSWMRGGKRLEITKSYNDDHQLISLSDNDGLVIKYDYLPNGKVHTITYPDGKIMTMDHDDKNRVIARTDFVGKRSHMIYNANDKGNISEIQVDKYRIQFEYGEDDNNMKGNLINQIARLDDGSETHSQFYYGGFRNLTKTTHFSKPTGTVFNTTHHFNHRGQIESIANHSHQGHKPSLERLQKYQYDSLNRLISEMHGEEHLIKTIDYHYDANNNLIVETYHDETNQHSVTHQYNGQDQRLHSIINDNHQETVENYRWNQNGHLEEAPDNTQFEYDSQGHLLSITHRDETTINYHYFPNGLLGKRTKGQKHDDFYHGANKKITSIKNAGHWYSLLSDPHGLQAGFSDESIDQFLLSGNNTGGLLRNNQHFQTTTYTSYGKPATPFKNDGFSSRFSWNQEYRDQDANLTYLQRRFYHPDLKLFLSRDSYPVDNHYAYAKANPVNFIDPTGHISKRAASYGIGSGLFVLGIIGAIFAVPTGGASLTPATAGLIGANVAGSLSGVSLMGSQGAIDTGHKGAAKAMQYASIGLSAAAIGGTGLGVLLTEGVAVTLTSGANLLGHVLTIPFYTAKDFNSYVNQVGKSVDPCSGYNYHSNSAKCIASRHIAKKIKEKIEDFYDTIDHSVSPSGESQMTFHASTGSVGSTNGKHSSPNHHLVNQSGSAGAQSATHDGAIHSRPDTLINSSITNSTPASEIATTPAIPGSFATHASIYNDINGANAAFTEDYYESMSGTQPLSGLDRSIIEESFPDGATE
jgi:RHS repeat-associated protein